MQIHPMSLTNMHHQRKRGQPAGVDGGRAGRPERLADGRGFHAAALPRPRLVTGDENHRLGGRDLPNDLSAGRHEVEGQTVITGDAEVVAPNVAILSASPMVHSRLASSLGAAALSKMPERHQIAGGIVTGPLPFDAAIDPDVARARASLRRPWPC